MRDASGTLAEAAHGGRFGSTPVAEHSGHAPLSPSQLSALVGEELGVSSWLRVDQAAIDAFADLTHDRQAIHVDQEASRAGPFGGTIAHGFLTLALLSAMSFDVVPTLEGQRAAVNYGFNSLRFVTPVRTGERIRGRFTLKQVAQRNPGSHQLTIDVTVEIEHQPKPALVAEWLTLINT
ncbi:MaoC family dehydratase [Paraburkholderia dipogonis]|uniref:MaoC family dehydratase n=1 Tax=Paraburkholderia dipogonis TaxID=1211383 RepID=A0A4Y8MWH7_9BURK|nr:MaoC family dehydratase [Paraburkholderia dipogonis]TFE41725.1 MaoC family dehydratase [Paraburkholderia dipogonis]